VLFGMSWTRELSLRKKMRKMGLDCLIVLKQENFTYFTGANLVVNLRSFSPEGAVIIYSEGKTTYIFPESEREKAKILPWHNLLTYSLTEPLATKIIESLPKRARIGIEEDFIPLAIYEDLRKVGTLVRSQQLIEEQRMVKDEQEIRTLKKAGEIVVEGMKRAFEVIHEGVTESYVAAEVENVMRKAGAKFIPLTTMVQGGKNTQYVHPTASEYQLKKNNLVIIDMACNYKNYISDMSRMAVLGELNKDKLQLYKAVRTAIEKGASSLKPGVKASDIHKVVEKEMKKAGLGRYFIYYSGRGVGLKSRELPWIKSGDTTLLEPNMVIALNPTIHIPDLGGARLEGIFQLTEDGCINLTPMSYDIFYTGK
jgi:Xaa-Pro aminopeptidase